MHVVTVGFAPVKGTRHTDHDAVELAPGGVVGDRERCLVDVERRHVLRTVQNPGLVGVRAVTTGDELRLELPSGEVAEGPTPGTGEELMAEYWGRPVPLRLLGGPHADLVSAHLGRPVRLAAAPRGGVVYGDAVTVVTTGSLRALADRLGRSADELDPARFRANVVVANDEPFAEEGWVGRELSLGTARVQVTGPVPRCAVVNLGPSTGERDLPVLRGLVDLAQQRGADGSNGPPFGVEARVVGPGVVCPGDTVQPR
jgi:uncharacterized protein YcbX